MEVWIVCEWWMPGGTGEKFYPFNLDKKLIKILKKEGHNPAIKSGDIIAIREAQVWENKIKYIMKAMHDPNDNGKEISFQVSNIKKLDLKIHSNSKDLVTKANTGDSKLIIEKFEPLISN